MTDAPRGPTTEAPSPRDEHGNDALGVCANCGAVMVENPRYPWCADCESDDD